MAARNTTSAPVVPMVTIRTPLRRSSQATAIERAESDGIPSDTTTTVRTRCAPRTCSALSSAGASDVPPRSARYASHARKTSSLTHDGATSTLTSQPNRITPTALVWSASRANASAPRRTSATLTHMLPEASRTKTVARCDLRVPCPGKDAPFASRRARSAFKPSLEEMMACSWLGFFMTDGRVSGAGSDMWTRWLTCSTPPGRRFPSSHRAGRESSLSEDDRLERVGRRKVKLCRSSLP